MTSVDRDRLRERLRPYVERARGFSGWSFAYAPRGEGPTRPWSYGGRARELLRASRRTVDLGTGGGERLAEIAAGSAGFAVATEEWVVNVPVASARLGPLGVRVVSCRSTELPFRDESFDLVLSRHEAIDPFEVARVLAPGGALLTQQVDNADWGELRDFFPAWQDHGDHWAYYQAGLLASGLTIVNAGRHYQTVAFAFEELVSQLCVMPWTIAEFDPLGHDLDALLELERMCSAEGELRVTEARYVIEARKNLTP